VQLFSSRLTLRLRLFMIMLWRFVPDCGPR
ncbi:MAG: hypothetical protein ACI9O0_001353, partial [Paracoccaceae bacterium]